MILKASMVRVHGSPWAHFEPLKLLNFDFTADPDPAFPSNADPDPQPWGPCQIYATLTDRKELQKRLGRRLQRTGRYWITVRPFCRLLDDDYRK